MHAGLSLDEINRDWLSEPAHLVGMRLSALAADKAEAIFTVDAARNCNPFGALHGGVTCLVAETIGSVASNILAASEQKRAVGLQLSANHMRGVKHGEQVKVVATLKHKGRSTHVWHVEFFNPAGQCAAFVTFTAALVGG